MASIASLCLNRTTLAAITVTLDRASQAWITANSQGLHLVPERSRSIHGSSPQSEPIDDAGRPSHLRNIQERKAIAHGGINSSCDGAIHQAADLLRCTKVRLNDTSTNQVIQLLPPDAGLSDPMPRWEGNGAQLLDVPCAV